jgi:hypothetical protein
MAITIIDYGSKEYQKMVDLRLEVLRKPLGLTFTQADLEPEKNDILIGAFDDEDLMACCILTKTSADTCKLRQMAVIQINLGTVLGHQRRNIERFALLVGPDRV